MKLRTDPSRVRLALAYYDLHGFRPTMRQFGLSSRSLARWIEAREEHGPDWPTLDMDREWLATRDYREHRAANLRRWRTRSYINRGSLLVDSVGTGRRIRALMAIGWNAQSIAAHGPWATGDALLEMAKRDRIHIDNRDAIARIYDQLCMTPGPSPDTRRRALRNGWPPPLAWDDNIDDPHAVPWAADEADTVVDEVVVERLLEGKRTPSTRAEKLEAMRRWLATGRSKTSLCDMHGWNGQQYVVERQDGAA